MRKILAGLFILIAGSFAFTQTSDWSPVSPDSPYDDEEFEDLKLKTQILTYTNAEVKEIVLKGSDNPNETVSFDDTCTIKIEYQPSYDEVRIYYECMYQTYDQGQAMNTVKAMLLNFQHENKYSGYKYLKDDRDKFFRDDKGRRKAQFISTLKFIR